jgi:NLR family CARD domain-containing protein 3
VFHEFGLWLHFDSPALRDTVVLDPQWIIDSFACIIRDFNLHTNASDRAVLMHAREFDDLTRLARLHSYLIPLLWERHSEGEREMLLQLMMDFSMLLPLRQHQSSKVGHSSGDQQHHQHQQYLVPALLPASLAQHTGEQHAAVDHDLLTDAMSDKFTRLMSRYTGRSTDLQDGWCEWYLAFLSYDVVAHRGQGGAVSTGDLVQGGLLPYGLFGRIVLELQQHQQLTSGRPPSRLSRTAAVLFLGPVELRLDLLDHLSCICVRAHTRSAMPIVRRLQGTVDALLKLYFPTVMCKVLLPYSPISLVDLDHVREALTKKSVMHIDDDTLSCDKLCICGSAGTAGVLPRDGELPPGRQLGLCLEAARPSHPDGAAPDSRAAVCALRPALAAARRRV